MTSDEKYPAKFTGRAGPDGTGEFYTGVTPGADGEAMKTTWNDGSETWSFHLPGGAWLSCQRGDIHLPEDQAGEQPAAVPPQETLEGYTEAWGKAAGITERDPDHAMFGVRFDAETGQLTEIERRVICRLPDRNGPDAHDRQRQPER